MIYAASVYRFLHTNPNKASRPVFHIAIEDDLQITQLAELASL